MYCPRCGQEQLARETVFCSKCGLRLDQVSLVLANDGAPIMAVASDSKMPRWLNRRNGLFFSIFWFLFWLMLVVPLSGAMGIDELAAFGAIFGFSGGVILLFSSLFLPGSSQPIQAFPERVKNKPTEIGEAGSPRAFLNDIHSTSSEYIQPSDLHNDESLNTGKLKVQISVTEHTTKLLSKEELDK